MSLETLPIDFWPWLREGAALWASTLLMGGLAALLGVYIVKMLVYGPMVAGERIVTTLLSAVDDLWHTSPRRVVALARLAIQETFRRRAIVGFGVFVVVLSFALWFLDVESYDPTALYMSSVLFITTLVSMALGVLMSVFSLPADLKSKTIYTVVTKPVRPSEIVLGRILGFVVVGTLQLAAMGVVSYVFIVRALDHTHELREEDLKEVDAAGAAAGTRQGRTSNHRGHFHIVTDHGEGRLTTDERQGHTHAVTVEERNGKKVYTLSSPQGQFHARVPIYGDLRFRDNAGNEKKSGLNVGKASTDHQWTNRSYVEGGTLAAALWTFSNVTTDRFPNGLRLDMNIRVFRTQKGNMDQGVVGGIVLRNPRTKVASAPRNFIAKEFVTDRHVVPRKLTSPDGKTLDLFEDLVDNGQVEVQLTCLQRTMFFGMAQPDVYLLASDESVLGNFIKGHIAIWMQMVLVICIGVFWSTFLNSAVAMLATISMVVGGVFRDFVVKLANNELYGGGPAESFVRLAGNKNVMVDLDKGLLTDFVKVLVDGLRYLLTGIYYALPDLSQMSGTAYLTDGFNIPWDRLAASGMMMLGYALPIYLLGFLCFKSREVAA